MSTLPAIFQAKNTVVEKHQLEGIDPSDRYFNRMVPITRVDRGYTANMMYEALTIQSESHKTVAGALNDIVDQLRALGFSKIRTRLNFKGHRYLAEKETWVEYPD